MGPMDNVTQLVIWAGLSVELLKAMGKGGTVTVQETMAALKPFEHVLAADNVRELVGELRPYGKG